MMSYLFVIFGIVDTLVTDGPEAMNIKRKIKNKQTARKSYDAKKKQRQELQEKNAELEDTQKELLHSKFKLETFLRLLQRVAESMDHVYSTCTSQIEKLTESQPKAANNVVRANHRNSLDVNNCCPLDLSVNCQRSSCDQDTLSTHSRQNRGYYGDANSVRQDDKNNGHMVENRVPSMEIKVPREVSLTSSLSNGDLIYNMDKIKKEVDIKQEVDTWQEVDIKQEVDIAPPQKKIKLEVMDE